MTTETKPCPHAHLRMEYAKDALLTDKPWKLWQLRSTWHEEWQDAWKELHWDPETSYRRKPRTININGFEVPEPMREVPEIGTRYYIASLFGVQTTCYWNGLPIDEDSLKAGVVHATYEAAELHSKALRSFTEVKGCER